MDEKGSSRRFANSHYRADAIRKEGETEPSRSATASKSRRYGDRTKQYLAVIHAAENVRQQIAKDSPVTPSELATLNVVGGEDTGAGVSASEIRTILRVSAAATSKTLAALESKGLVMRAADARDRRVSRLRLTVTGEQVYRDHRVLQEALLARVFERMGARDSEEFLSLWERFNHLMEEECRISTDIVQVRRDEMKTVYIEDCDFSFTAGDVLQRMAMPRDHEFGEQIRALMARAADIAAPRAFYMELPIEARSANSVTIGGQTFQSVALAKNLEKVDTVYPFLCTCGPELAAFAQGLDDIMEQYAFDAIMDFYRLRAQIALTEALANALPAGGQTSKVNPGSLVDWPIHEQKKLFTLFGERAERIGVSLNAHCLMTPAKTVSGIRYATDKIFHNCQLCQRASCPDREAPFDLSLLATTMQD